jgi:hypothetical protein
MPSKNFPQQPFDPVPLGCVPDFAAGSDAEAIMLQPVQSLVHKKVGRFKKTPLLSDQIEFTTVFKTCGRRKSLWFTRGHRFIS